MLTRTTPLPPIALADPVWTGDQLEAALHLRERATRTLIADRAPVQAARARPGPLGRPLVRCPRAHGDGAARCVAPQVRPGKINPDADALAEIATLRTRRAGAR